MKDKCVIYITTNHVIASNAVGSEKQTFEIGTIREKAVLKEDKLKETIIEVLGKISAKKAGVVILISEDLLFSKQIQSEDPEKADTEVKKFLESLPFKSEEISVVKYEFQGKKTVTAINKNVYLPLITVLENIEWKVESILPATVFGEFVNEETMASEKVEFILNRSGSLEAINFLKNSSVVEKEEKVDATENLHDQIEESNRPFIKKLLIGLFSFLLLTTIVTAYLILTKNSSNNLPEAKIEPTATPTPTLIPILKSDIKIKILNGSGVAGQAGKIKEKLIALDFKDIETGNADEATLKGKSTVEFSKKIPKSLQDEIVSELNKSLSNVVVSSSASGLSVDVLITTGK
ncbi:MAG: LytR C-terminal domain-containing protein [Patescibacteria group bacterium]|nr:LytR C-terminal domain-containing protein [Patescibacteria group bacterium]